MRLRVPQYEADSKHDEDTPLLYDVIMECLDHPTDPKCRAAAMGVVCAIVEQRSFVFLNFPVTMIGKLASLTSDPDPIVQKQLLAVLCEMVCSPSSLASLAKDGDASVQNIVNYFLAALQSPSKRTFALLTRVESGIKSMDTPCIPLRRFVHLPM